MEETSLSNGYIKLIKLTHNNESSFQIILQPIKGFCGSFQRKDQFIFVLFSNM